MAPMPRAATTVRQRTQPITAISTSKIQMLLPPSRKVPTTADSLSSSLRVGTSGGGSSSGASHATSAAHTTSKGTLGASTPTHGAVRKTAPTAPSSLNASGTAGSSGYVSKQLVKKTGTAAEKIAALSNAAHVSSAAQHHAAKASGAGSTLLTVSSGNVAIGGAVPQPHHSTLRAPNPGRKSLHSATLHSSMAAAASPPHARGVVPPPPPLRQPSSSIGRHNNTPPGGRLGSPPPRATDTSTGSSLAAVVTFCTQCGNRYVEGAKFCAFCGHRREDPVTPVSTLTAAERKRDHVSSSPSAAEPSETLVVSLQSEDISEPPQAISTN
ncbi:Hypothetical protein, putative [Bodo saltans]|uniref:Zinc-ribbon domain-containing protein n=1 Tax=Bodo saltans TaxID=75058 RepID=A0A0S4JQY8_BODSA|nr:Hypothetical protein, putative [Bodo saltans]|eukprot:CUG91724.1 Hypothetical protein, putative [Bodo saltans]